MAFYFRDVEIHRRCYFHQTYQELPFFFSSLLLVSLLFFVPCRAVNRLQSTDCHHSSLGLDVTLVHCYFTGQFVQDQNGNPTAAPVSCVQADPSAMVPIMLGKLRIILFFRTLFKEYLRNDRDKRLRPF